MSDSAISNAINALLPTSPNAIEQLQLFAQKQVQDTQVATAAGLISSLSPQAVPALGLGGNIDIRI